MRIMKFEGATMRDAIAKVKAELGDQAVIISSRQVRKGLLGHAVEISAAIDDGDESVATEESSKPLANTPAFAQKQAYNTPAFAQQKDNKEVEEQMASLRTELRSLRAMVRSSNQPTNNTKLESEIAALRQLVEQMAVNAAAAPLPTKNIAKIASAETISAAVQGLAKRREIIPEEPVLVAPSTARVVMLVGPTGAGKTTTIAKLAAHAALVEGRRVRIITLDTFRIGGVDQIRTYADLIGVDLAVCERAGDLANAIDDEDDLTLVDTAGRSPKDVASVIELAAATASIAGLETHLVIPASSTTAIIDELVTRYTALAPQRLLFTKCDEHDAIPELLAAPKRTRLPITWVTTGQQVPEDLEQPTARRVGELAAHGLTKTNNRHRAA
ncbi:MAG TPA: flagellar biosynthesis protein FlhF [Kofleriaceae bacterium]|jgi:flagellar biosynthesis protein FlhF